VFLRTILIGVLLLLGFASVFNTDAADPRIKKVLPQFIDAKERNSLSPSLYERDAYQAYLRSHPDEREGLRFAVLWRGTSAGKQLRLRVEMRGVVDDAIHVKSLERPVQKAGWFSTWSWIVFRGEDYKKFGELAAWRVTLWDGDKQVSEQRSFLW